MPPRKNLVTSDQLAAAEPASPSRFNGAPEEAFDHDGDGEPGGSLPHSAPPVVVTRPPEPAAPPVVGEVLKAGAPPPELPVNLPANAPVRVRITKTGHGQVHDGKGGTYNWQDELTLPYGVARAQEKNSNVEIIGR